jgi:hypothetical protein
MARAEAGQRIDGLLDEIAELQRMIDTGPTETLEDAAVKLRRLGAYVERGQPARRICSGKRKAPPRGRGSVAVCGLRLLRLGGRLALGVEEECAPLHQRAQSPETPFRKQPGDLYEVPQNLS